MNNEDVIYYYAEMWDSGLFHTGEIELENAVQILKKYNPMDGWIVEFSLEPYMYDGEDLFD